MSKTAADVSWSLRHALQGTLIPRLLQGTVTLVSSDTWNATGGDAEDEAAGIDDLPSRVSTVLHAHAAHEICWVVQGRCVLTVAGRHHVLDSSVACLVQSGEAHQLRPTLTLEPFDVLWWHATTRGISLPVVRFGANLDVIHGGFVAVEPSPAAAVARAAMELRQRQAQWDLVVRAIALQLAAHIVRGLDGLPGDQAAKNTAGRGSSRHVERVADYIRTNFDADLTLDHLASLVSVSPYYLTTLFRRYLGRSAMVYLGEVRHRHACEMLRSTETEVAEIGRLVGYRDPYYFSRVFKAGEGCSPLEYRRRHRAVPAALSSAHD